MQVALAANLAASQPAVIPPSNISPPNVSLPSVTAEAAVLMVAGTRQVLFDKDANKIMYPASTTKMVTLLTALRHGKLTDVVVVGPQAVDIEGSSLGLKLFDELTLQDLLYGMMLVSGNDASYAVAEHVGGGSVAKFLGWMNEEAEKAGAMRTHFTNPHGLPDPINHFSTAYDLALIATSGLADQEFAKIVATPVQTVQFINRGQTKQLANTNKLLFTYTGASGVKTGETRAAGKCLVASAKRGNVQLIAVVLNAGDNRWQEAAQLLDYGFRVMELKRKAAS